MAILDCIFQQKTIRFENYPFSAASIYPSGSVGRDQIKEIIISHCPPEVRLNTGEILFVSAVYKDTLRDYAIKYDIPIVDRVDIWGWILEPFLDTEFTAEDEEKVYQILVENDIGQAEWEEIRESVGRAMIAYNFLSGLWEWAHLGQFDLLQAYSGILSGEKFKLPEKEFKDIYWMTMELANRAKKK